jgi:hypothetical protein
MLLNIVDVAKLAKCDIVDLPWRMYDENGEFATSTVARRFGSWEKAKKRASKVNVKELRANVKKAELAAARQQKREDILEAYLTLVRETGEAPTIYDLANAGVYRETFRTMFGTISNLELEAREKEPEAFTHIYLGSLFSPKTLKTLNQTIAHHKRFVVTTAVNGCDVHDLFYSSLKHYCEANDASLLILVASDPSHNLDKGNQNVPKHARYGTIDKALKNEQFIINDTILNSNVWISTFKTSAKMIDPLTGTNRLGQRQGSIILASTKQRLQPVPVSNHKLPHVIMSTGAITKSDYSTENYMSERLAYLADYDHQIGAIVVEVEDDEMFHYRQIQADAETGCFYEIANGVYKKYTPTGVMAPDGPAPALVLGDWHSGETDPDVAACWSEVATIVKPDHVVIHDGFNGLAINHHEDGDTFIKARRAQDNKLSLREEVVSFANDLDTLATWANKSVVVVKSNHDEFLARYLKEARYIYDPQNHYFALKLSLAMFEGLDPLRHAVEDQVGLKEPEKVRWLQRSEDFKVARIQLGAHGDKGPNGSRGTLSSMEKAYGQSVTGHSHVPGILRGAWSVGTSSYLKLDYNSDSPSSWMNASCIVYPNGQRQLVNVILGRWRL